MSRPVFSTVSHAANIQLRQANIRMYITVR